MPFRRLVEHGHAQLRYCIGLDPFANSLEHRHWFQQHGGLVEGLDPAAWPNFPGQFVSVDLDVLDAAFAPGVSAANPCGMSPSQLAAYVEAAGRCREVVCFDIMELCPPHDVGARTARLAAHLLLRFVQGCCARLAAEHVSADHPQ